MNLQVLALGRNTISEFRDIQVGGRRVWGVLLEVFVVFLCFQRLLESLCCAVLCCAVLRCAVLCRSVLCFAVLWCSVLCCAVLCSALSPGHSLTHGGACCGACVRVCVRVCEWRAQKLSHLPVLRSLSFHDVHFGSCPVADMEGYRDFVIVSLGALTYADGSVEHCVPPRDGMAPVSARATAAPRGYAAIAPVVVGCALCWSCALWLLLRRAARLSCCAVAIPWADGPL